MTPEEAIKIINKAIIESENVIAEFSRVKTLAECKSMVGEYYANIQNSKSEIEACKVAIEALKEIQMYREIGTVEECCEAVEKQKPKDPKDELKINPVIDENGAYVDADTIVYLICPNCGEMVGIDENVDKFCRECGQAIDTENLEEIE